MKNYKNMHNIICDENIGKSFVNFLRKEGFSVYWITESCPWITDEEVLGIAESLKGILITSDKDFAQMTFAHNTQSHVSISIVLLREFFFEEIVARTLKKALDDIVFSHRKVFVVIWNKSVRIRYIP